MAHKICHFYYMRGLLYLHSLFLLYSCIVTQCFFQKECANTLRLCLTILTCCNRSGLFSEDSIQYRCLLHTVINYLRLTSVNSSLSTPECQNLHTYITLQDRSSKPSILLVCKRSPPLGNIKLENLTLLNYGNE
jgi:hypothetical protein